MADDDFRPDGQMMGDGENQVRMDIVIPDDYYKKHAPYLKRRLKPSKALLKKHPRLLFLVQYGDNEPTMVFGPAETKEERLTRYAENRHKKGIRASLSKTKAEIRDGKQTKVSSYFRK